MAFRVILFLTGSLVVSAAFPGHAAVFQQGTLIFADDFETGDLSAWSQVTGSTYSCEANPCQNGGTCSGGVDTYYCHCPEGFTGENCEYAASGVDPGICPEGSVFFDATPVVRCWARCDDELLFHADAMIADWPGLNQVAATYAWDFSDGYDTGIAGGGRAITHSYNRRGEFTTTLTTTDPTLEQRQYTVTTLVEGMPPPSPPPLVDQPVLELCFDGSLVDSSGNEVGIDWVGAPGSFVPGISGQALDLSGGSYVVVPSFTELAGSSGVTISLWVKGNARDWSGVLLEQPNPASTYNPFVRLEWDGATTFTAQTTAGRGRAQAWDQIVDISENTQWHHVAATYDGATMRVYVDGIELRFFRESTQTWDAPGTHSGALVADATGLYVGGSSSGTVFAGQIDELKIYDRALTAEEIFVGFELWHAPFHARTAQFIDVHVPPALRDPAHTLRVQVFGGGLTQPMVLVSTPSPAALEQALLPHLDLPGSTREYVLSAQVLHSNGSVLAERQERFIKSYDGAPELGINQHNAFVLRDGEGVPQPFFPVVPFCLNNESVTTDTGEYWQDWEGNAYVNALSGQGFWPPDRTLASWIRYLEEAENLKTFGPTLWEGLPPAVERASWRNADLDNLSEYVVGSRDHEALLGWVWADEPDLGDIPVPAPALRSWILRTHGLDNQHSVTQGLVGSFYRRSETMLEVEGPDEDGRASNVTRRWNYVPARNAALFGRETQARNGVFLADVYNIDYYPFDWAAPHTSHATMTLLADSLDNLARETYDMVPLTSYVETTDINEDPLTPWHPTPEHLTMLIWINIIHGAKSTNWFHYHTRTPAANFQLMAEHTARMAELAPVVLAPEPTAVSTVDYGEAAWQPGSSYALGEVVQHRSMCWVSTQSHTAGLQTEPGQGPLSKRCWQVEKRVDVMVREHEGQTYLFAVRVSELQDTPNPAYAWGSDLVQGEQPNGWPDPMQDFDITPAIHLSTLEAGLTATVLYEDRTLILGAGGITDTFVPFAVHIYQIDSAGSAAMKDDDV